MRRASAARNSGSGISSPIEPEIGGGVLDEQAPPEVVLGPSHVVGHHVEGLPGHRHRQQVGEEAVPEPTPGQVLRDHERLETVDELLQPVQVVPGRRLAGAERHADPVQGEGILGADRLQVAKRRPSLEHVVLGVDLEPAEVRPGLEYRSVVLGLETHPRPVGRGPTRVRGAGRPRHHRAVMHGRRPGSFAEVG